MLDFLILLGTNDLELLHLKLQRGSGLFEHCGDALEENTAAWNFFDLRDR